jgi:multidrug efflux pump subunit AcrA (membrane-fusion protein)
MNKRQRIIAIFVLVMGWVISGCGPSPALSPTPTIMPFPPTLAPTVTQVSFPTDTVTPPPTTAPFVTEASVSPEVGSIYAIDGIAPDGKVFSGKLTITLNSENSGSST